VESGETKRLFTSVDVTALLNEVAESFAPEFENERRTFLWSSVAEALDFVMSCTGPALPIQAPNVKRTNALASQR
jgi:hypothetical protein